MIQRANTIIESLGVYLPPREVSTAEVLEGCQQQIRFPLEKITGIESRRMAGEEEFSIDLAKKAVQDCLDHSKYSPSDIDLLVCCNISRFDDRNLLSFEPSTSARLKVHFGFDQAIAFDLSNACAGMFTGIFLVDNLLKTGAVRRAMVVSGEYITHLTQTAQREIESFMDTRIACLTLGDAGAAIILENGTGTDTGFHQIHIQSLGRYSPFCIGKPAESGDWIMYTDSVNMADAAISSGANHALSVLAKAAWPPDSFQHLIMHQTSKMTLNSAKREINKRLNGQICRDDNTVNNLTNRGNTASTSHMVALADQIQNEAIQAGDKIVFSIAASGLTVGTALYTMDQLPDRLAQANGKAAAPSSVPFNEYLRTEFKQQFGVRTESIGVCPQDSGERRDSMEMLERAAQNCLEQSSYQASDIELLIYCGVYRTDYIVEPAYATLLAGKLDMNGVMTDAPLGEQQTFAFDLFNGAVGFLNAVYVAQQLIAAGRCRNAMVVAAEVNNNALHFPQQADIVQEAASAIILDAHPEGKKGLSSIAFGYKLDALADYQTHCTSEQNGIQLHINTSPKLQEHYLAAIQTAVVELLARESIELDKLDLIIPPQISSEFLNQLSDRLGVARSKLVEVENIGADLLTSSIPYGLALVHEQSLAQSGDRALLITVGSGIQAGCAIYQF